MAVKKVMNQVSVEKRESSEEEERKRERERARESINVSPNTYKHSMVKLE
jgi:hypothetical protein